MLKCSATGNSSSAVIFRSRPVTSDTGKVNLNPDAEHGFSCAQNAKDHQTNKVSGVLRSVAVNHSTGKSSVNLKNVKIPNKKASSVSMATGVSGPVGRKISVQLGISLEMQPEVIKADTPKIPNLSKLGTAAEGNEAVPGKGKANFKKAIKALNKFKCIVRVVTATNKLKRGPLTTILKIPQEQAMAKMIDIRNSSQLQEIKHLAYTDGAKVANLSVTDIRKTLELKRKSSQRMVEAEKSKNEELEMIENAFNFIVPS